MLTAEWRPISTYVPNRDPVLLYWPYWSEHVVIGEYTAHEAGKNYWYTETWLGEDAEDPGPTHWMPLPEPPR